MQNQETGDSSINGLPTTNTPASSDFLKQQQQQQQIQQQQMMRILQMQQQQKQQQQMMLSMNPSSVPSPNNPMMMPMMMNSRMLNPHQQQQMMAASMSRQKQQLVAIQQQQQQQQMFQNNPQQHSVVMNQPQQHPQSPRKPWISRESFGLIYSAFCKQNELSIPQLPIISNRKMDLYTSFVAVMQFGGLEVVLEKNLWWLVLKVLGFVDLSSPAASAASIAQNQPLFNDAYGKCLLKFELHYAENEQNFLARGLIERALPPKQKVLENVDRLILQQQQQQQQQQPLGHIRQKQMFQQSPQAQQSRSSSISLASQISPSTSIAPPQLPHSPVQHRPQSQDNRSSDSPAPKKSKLPFITRVVETFGGIDLDSIHRALAGEGEANTRKMYATKHDLQCLDWNAIYNCLISGLRIEIYKALKTLLILSMDENVEISDQSMLINELVNLWGFNLKTFYNAKGYLDSWRTQLDKNSHWNYLTLFEFERDILQHWEYGATCVNGRHNILDHVVLSANFYSDYQGSVFNAKESARKIESAELLLIIGTIFRNFTLNAKNSEYLANNIPFLNHFWSYASIRPSNSDTRPSNSDLHVTFLDHYKNSLALIQNLSRFLPAVDEEQCKLLLQILSDFLMPPLEMPNDIFDFSTCLSIHSLIPVYDDHYSLSAMEGLNNLLSNPDFREKTVEYPDLLLKCIRGLLPHLPFGFPQRFNQPNSKNMVHLQPWYDLNKIQISIRCIYRISQTENEAVMNRLAMDSTLHRLMVRLTTGFSWINTPIYASDPEFDGTTLGNGVTGMQDRTTPAERESIQEVYVVVSRSASRIFRNILRHINNQEDELHPIVQFWRRNYEKYRESLWTASGKCPFSIDVMISEKDNLLTIQSDSLSRERIAALESHDYQSDIGEIERAFVGLIFNSKVLPEMNEIAAEILSLIALIERRRN